jgi:hypothetical protein
MKSNQIVRLIHLWRVFISIQLLIKVVWGAYINLLIRGAKVKGQNYFTKLEPIFTTSPSALEEVIKTDSKKIILIREYFTLCRVSVLRVQYKYLGLRGPDFF